MRPQEHYQEAERLLEEGRRVVGRISELADERRATPASDVRHDDLTRRMDELGKKAMGIWAQAQVHATLATLKTTPVLWGNM